MRWNIMTVWNYLKAHSWHIN